VGVGALVRDERLARARRFRAICGDGVVDDAPAGVGVVAADRQQDRTRRPRDADEVAGRPVDGVPRVGVGGVGGREQRVGVDRARSPPAVALAVRDVLGRPVVERRPRADGRERTDQAAAVPPGRGLEPAVGGERAGLLRIVELGHRGVGERRGALRDRLGGPGSDRDAGVRPVVADPRRVVDDVASDRCRRRRRRADVHRERRVPSRLVRDRRIQACEHDALDREPAVAERRRYPVCDERRAHPRLARVRVVHADDRHRWNVRSRGDKRVSGSPRRPRVESGTADRPPPVGVYK